MAAETQPNSTPKSGNEGYTRLHITPFDAELLKIVVPAAVLPQARNISYHTLDTFPDRRYGYVELPSEDAGRLRKKLNGATLKGTKVHIEQARPEVIPQPTGTMGDESADVKRAKKDKKDKKIRDKKEKSKKRKLGIEVAEGVLIEDRKIKRGWTVTESDKIQEKRKDKTKKTPDTERDAKKEKKLKKRELKSKYTDAPECLFKQKITQGPSEPASTEQQGDDGEEPERKKRKGDKLLVVHEFKKTHKYPTFLRDTGEKAAPEPLTFEDGKGWLDAQGNVVETAKNKRPSFSSEAKTSKKRVKKPDPADYDDTSSSGSSSESNSDDEAPAPAQPVSSLKASHPISTPEDDDTSSSVSSSDEKPTTKASPVVNARSTHNIVSKPLVSLHDSTKTNSGRSSSDEGSGAGDKDDETTAVKRAGTKKLQVDTKPPSSPTLSPKNDSARPKSSSSATSLTIKIPPITPALAKVHPLEALYKRPAGTEAPAADGFSFFGNNDDIEEGDDSNPAPSGSQNPMTPYSKQDFDFRNVRSAAPTPDTAHPSRSYNLWPRLGPGEDTLQEEDEEDEDAAAGEEEDAEIADATDPKATGKADPKSEFQDWFWEHRGDLNRSWKKRRKTASKEKRNRENRTRAARAI